MQLKREIQEHFSGTNFSKALSDDVFLQQLEKRIVKLDLTDSELLRLLGCVKAAWEGIRANPEKFKVQPFNITMLGDPDNYYFSLFQKLATGAKLGKESTVANQVVNDLAWAVHSLLDVVPKTAQ